MKKNQLLLMSVLFCSQAFGASALKQIETDPGGRVKFIFNEALKKDQVSIELIKDFIQLTFKRATVHPAKVLPVESQQIKKVFAYQYTPDLVRCRIFLQRSSELLKEQLKWTTVGREVSVDLGSLTQEVVLEEDLAAADTEKSLEKSPSAVDLPVEASTETKMSENLSETQASLKSEEIEALPGGIAHLSQDQPSSLTSSHPLPSLRSALMKLGLIVLIFVFGALLFHFGRKLFKSPSGKKKNKSSQGSLFKSVTQFARNSMKKDEGMIEVISTHHLDPRMKIAVVRVGGRLLVLGISPDSMNLITQLPDDDPGVEEKIEEEIEEEIISHSNQSLKGFSDILKLEAQEGRFSPPPPSSSSSGIRSRIKNRLEGLKPL